MRRFCLVLSLWMMILALAGCGALQVALTKKDLDVQTRMSQSIFMDLVNQKNRRVYVAVRDTSGKGLSLAQTISNAIAGRGYEIVSSPSQAGYILQINVLSCNKADVAAIDKTLGCGYGGSVATGIVTGALIGSATHSGYGMATGAAIGGLAAGIGELVADSLVKDVTYALITDVQLTEFLKKGKHVHRTRMASTANKVNLKFEDARYPLESAMASSLAGIF